jgi:large subunit ribosomal protein L9
MKVLLLNDLKGVGKRNEIKDVSDGYARNYLIPKNLAKPANDSALKLKNRIDTEEKEFIDEIQGQADHLARERFEFQLATGKKGEVFGSVSSDEIKKALSQKGYRDLEIDLKKPLKILGSHKIPVRFPRGVKTSVEVALISELSQS